MEAVIDAGSPGLQAEIVTLPDPRGGAEKVLALEVSSGYSEHQNCGSDTVPAIQVHVKNAAGNPTATAKLNVESIAALTPVAYEIYSIPDNGKYSVLSKGDIEAQIRAENADFSLMARYTDPDGDKAYEKEQGEGAALVKNDKVYLVATVQYSEGGDRFVLDASSILGWYDTDALPDQKFTTTARNIGAGTENEIQVAGWLDDGTGLSGYSTILRLQANGAGESGRPGPSGYDERAGVHPIHLGAGELQSFHGWRNQLYGCPGEAEAGDGRRSV